MGTGVHLALLCGYCPTRRVLGHVTVYADRTEPLLMVSIGRRQWRPKQATPVTWQPVTDQAPLRVRCRKGHPGSPQRQELLSAYERAAEAGRRELTLGVDL
jgi:hypothetical protein